MVVASKAGSPQHPAPHHNVKANPTVDIHAPGGRSGRYVGHEVDGEERARLWEKVNDLYAGYDVYQGRPGARRIPLIVFSPLYSLKLLTLVLGWLPNITTWQPGPAPPLPRPRRATNV